MWRLSEQERAEGTRDDTAGSCDATTLLLLWNYMAIQLDSPARWRKKEENLVTRVLVLPRTQTDDVEIESYNTDPPELPFPSTHRCHVREKKYIVT